MQRTGLSVRGSMMKDADSSYMPVFARLIKYTQILPLADFSSQVQKAGNPKCIPFVLSVQLALPIPFVSICPSLTFPPDSLYTRKSRERSLRSAKSV